MVGRFFDSLIIKFNLKAAVNNTSGTKWTSKNNQFLGFSNTTLFWHYSDKQVSQNSHHWRHFLANGPLSHLFLLLTELRASCHRHRCVFVHGPINFLIYHCESTHLYPYKNRSITENGLMSAREMFTLSHISSLYSYFGT